MSKNSPTDIIGYLIIGTLLALFGSPALAILIIVFIKFFESIFGDDN